MPLAFGRCAVLRDKESSRRAGSHGWPAGDAAVPFLLEVLEPVLPTGGRLQWMPWWPHDPEHRRSGASAPCVLVSMVIGGGARTTEVLPDLKLGCVLPDALFCERSWLARVIMCAEHCQRMVSHRNDQLQVPIMLPPWRPLAARYVIALAQVALGRLADRWAAADNGSLYRTEILAALRPWSRNACPRVRNDHGRAVFQLCAGLATAARSVTEMSKAAADSIAAEVKLLREVVQAGAYSEVKNRWNGCRELSLAVLGRFRCRSGERGRRCGGGLE